MQDRQEKAQSSVQSESQVEVPDRTSGKGHGSGKELPPGLPATLPDRLGNNRIPTEPTDLTLEAPRQDNKHPHDDVDEITEVPNEDILAGPPKKKKKKNKGSRDVVPARIGKDDAADPSTSMAEPDDVANEATPVTASTKVPAEETKTSKKKKKHKKDARLEKFRLEQREVKAKEMSKIKHRKLQREQDFQAIRSYRMSIPNALLDTINGVDHSSYLLERYQKENNYMNKKCGHKQNLMTVKRLLTRIAKYEMNRQNASKRLSKLSSPPFRWCWGCPVGTSTLRNVPHACSRTVTGMS